MAKSSNQKLKLLYLLKTLNEKTDEENTMTINDMIAELDRYGITAERKSIYDDLEALRHYGLDIASRKSKTTDYYVLADYLSSQSLNFWSMQSNARNLSHTKKVMSL